MKHLFLSILMTLVLVGCGKRHNGDSGLNGSNGQSGLNSVIALTDAPSCVNGGTTILSGLDLNSNGVLDASEVSVSSQVCNGTDGLNGSNGQDASPSPFTPVSIVNPCGDAPGIYDEVFLKLQNGTLIASFSDNANGQNTRFSVLTAGSYQTTDGDNCVFTLDSSGNITSENHHY